MENSFQYHDETQFADGQNYRDLRDGPGATQLDSRDHLEALRENPEQPSRQIELPDVTDSEPYGTSSGSPRFRRISKRVLLVVLLILALGAVAPFAWNYLQSYESTDDAQIDGHIDPLSSRIDGTVIRVYPEDDDRVHNGERLGEIDPRDYQVAVEQAKARLGLALAQVASAKQDYSSALANVREADATNYKAQRDANRYTILLDQQVVPQEQYDQFTAVARVDAAKVDSQREAAGSALKTIAAREADADGAR